VTQREFPSPDVTGTPPRYLDLMFACRDRLAEQLSSLLQRWLAQLDNIILKVAENAETDAFRSHCLEVMHEMLRKRSWLEQAFSQRLNAGFDDFIYGRGYSPAGTIRTPTADQLALVDKEDQEISLALANAVHNANANCALQLYTLSHRLALVNGGSRLGEFSPALPACPAQIGDAFRAALMSVDFPVHFRIRIALVKAFDQCVLRETGKLYDEFNERLVWADILPNLALGAVQSGGERADRPDTVAAPAAEQKAFDGDAGDEEPVSGNEIFQEIRAVLARRRPGPPDAGARPSQPANAGDRISSAALISLLDSLKSAPAANSPPAGTPGFGQPSLESIKDAYHEQLAKLTELVKQQRMSAADADIIDLVGMLFDFILQDEHLPDSVKALLSQLHTPILKVAILDPKFFLRSRHPARKLLNAMAQAGALCSEEETDEHGVFAKLKWIVERILDEFEGKTEIFGGLLDDFNVFLDNFRRRTKLLEKRAVETAKGRERLREARQTVSREIVDRTWNRKLPKVAEELLMGPWANYLALVCLRHGTDSSEWQAGLSVANEVIWSVEPKVTESERATLRAKAPGLEKAIKQGLAAIGDPAIHCDRILRELSACQQALPAAESGAPPADPGRSGSGLSPDHPRPEAPPDVHRDKAIWADAGPPATSYSSLIKQAPPELLAIISQLKTIKLGTWFEFVDAKKNAKRRAKLSWYSPKTAYYIFVDQAGIQVAVKSLRALSREMREGETRILPLQKTPLMDRALESIHATLKRSEHPGSRA
jgi:hypothetical protein